MAFKLFETQNKPGIIESGKALVSQKGLSFSGVDDVKADADVLKMYENAYLRVPLVSSAVDILTDQTVQEFHFEGPNSKAMLEFADKHNLLQFFYRVCKSMLIFGDAYVELVKIKDEISALKVLDPKTMDVIRKKTGKVIGYTQTVDMISLIWGEDGKGNQHKQRVGKVEDIVHFKFNVIGSDKNGTSLIQRVLPIVDQKLNMEQYMSKVVERYIAPIIHAKVGNEEHPASSTDINAVEEALEDIERDTEYVTSHLVDMDVLGFQGKTLDFLPLFNHVDSQIIAGMMVPGIFLGGSDKVDGAIAEVQLRALGRTVKAIQRNLKVEFEDNVISKVMNWPEDKLVWGSVEEREKTVDIDMIRGLVKDGLLSKQKGNDLLPPRFHETLPEEVIGIDPRATQGNSPDKIKDNPNNPTLTTDTPGKKREKKNDVVVPMDNKGGVKKNQPKVKKRGVPK